MTPLDDNTTANTLPVRWRYLSRTERVIILEALRLQAAELQEALDHARQMHPDAGYATDHDVQVTMRLIEELEIRESAYPPLELNWRGGKF